MVKVDSYGKMDASMKVVGLQESKAASVITAIIMVLSVKGSGRMENVKIGLIDYLNNNFF